MQTVELPPTRNAGTASAFAFERAIQTTERNRSKQSIAPFIAQWEVLITMFKHGIEIPCLIELKDAPTVTQHRTTLTGLLSMGEVIWAQTNEGEDRLVADSGYDKNFISSNLNYLRIKYREWYGTADVSLIEQDRKTIWDALADNNH